MRPFQFTVRALLGLAAVVAVGCAAMVNAGPVWSSAVFGTVMIVLVVTLVRALILGHRAPFSVGFAAVGWVYFMFAVGPWSSYLMAQLPTEAALVHLAAWKYQFPVDGTSGRWYLAHVAPFSSAYTSAPTEKELNAVTFCAIGQGVITLALACCGGIFGAYLAANRNRRDEPSGP